VESVLEDDDSRLDYRADRWTAYRTERRSAQRAERRDLRRTELAVGLIIMLCGGFTYRVKAEKASANQGIKLSLKNSLVVLLVTSLTVGLIIDLIGSLFRGQIGGVWGWRVFRQLAAPIVGLSVGLIVGLNRGGPPRSSTISYD